MPSLGPAWAMFAGGRLGCLCSSASPIIRAAATISQAGDQPRGIRLFLVRIVPAEACIADEMARRAVLVRIIDVQGHARHSQTDGACAALLNEHGVSRPRTWVSSTASKPSPPRDERGTRSRSGVGQGPRARGRSSARFQDGTRPRDPGARSRDRPEACGRRRPSLRRRRAAGDVRRNFGAYLQLEGIVSKRRQRPLVRSDWALTSRDHSFQLGNRSWIRRTEALTHFGGRQL